MARIRTIKPEFPQSESMGRCSRDARLCFVMLWTIADDAGRLRGNSRMLASLLFPYDDDAKKLIDRWLAELERERCVTRYEVDGDAYLQINEWVKHQKIDRPTPSKIAPPSSAREDSRGIEKGSEASALDQGRDQGEEGTKPAAARRAASTAKPPTSGFEAFYAAYPRKVKPKDARKAWDKLKPDDALQARILTAIAAQKCSQQWTKDGGQFIPYPATWLNGGEWDNEVPADGQSIGGEWWESTPGIRAKGVELGVGDWDRDAWESGRGGPDWLTFRSSVFRAAGHGPWQQRDAAPAFDGVLKKVAA